MKKMTRLTFPVLAAAAALAILAGCGGSDSSGGGDPASLAPAESGLYIEATVRPSGKLADDVDSLAQTIGGVDNLGNTIVELLESSAESSGETFDYEKEVAPWLGEKAGISFAGFDGDDFSEYGIAIETTDADAAKEFIDEKVGESDDEPEEASYEGNDYWVEDDETAIGVVGDFVLGAETPKAFEAAVDASDGENLAGSDNFASTFDSATPGSIADVFVDVGGLIEQSGGEVDKQTEEFLESTGIELDEATAVASLVPGADQIEIDLSSDLAGAEAPSGNASELLGSLPDESFAAIAVAGFGDQLTETIDKIDESGIPGELPPNQLKSTLKQAGIDIDEIAGSIEDAAVVAAGENEKSLEVALVLTTDDAAQASETVSTVQSLVEQTGTAGIHPINGQAKGFEVRSPDLDGREVVVIAEGKRIAVGYGLATASLALASPKEITLSASPVYKDAVKALGGTPISGFADGPKTIKLIEGMLSPEEKADFAEAKPYLKKIEFASIGSTTEGDTATAKLIVGLEK